MQVLLKCRRPVLMSVILLSLSILSNTGAATSNLTEFTRLKNLNLAELAKGAITAERRPEVNMDSGLAAEACFIIRQPINVALRRLEQWNAVGNPDLDVSSHGRVSAKASPNDFASIAMPYSGKVSLAALLSSQARAFQQKGISGITTRSGNGDSLSPARDLKMLLSQLKQWSEYFRPVLDRGGVRGAPQKNYGYWEQIAVEGKVAIVLGSFTSTSANGGFQALDLQYFSTSGFSVAATFYQLWPVRIGNNAATLAWRCSMVSTPRVKELRGVERRAAGVAFKNRIRRYSEAIASDLQ